MAKKLKNLRMTSVDLVRNGANQEANICLFKSADPTEDPATPTTEEKNIFKRFLDWLRQNPAEELEDPIEKADEEPYLVEIYKSAITESLQSIVADETLSETEKNDMIAKSLDEYHEAMLDLFGFGSEDEPLQKAAEEDEEIDWGEDEEVEKANPNRDALGRFASSPGGGGGGNASPMEFKRDKIGNYRNTAGDMEISKYRGQWEVYAISSGEKRQYIGARYTLKEAKELASKSRADDVGVNKSADIDEIEEV